VAGGRRRLHNGEPHNLYASPDIVRVIKLRRIRWAWHVARMGSVKNAYKILIGKPKGKTPVGRPSKVVQPSKL
jgi:hypothetical protein